MIYHDKGFISISSHIIAYRYIFLYSKCIRFIYCLATSYIVRGDACYFMDSAFLVESLIV